MALPVLTNAQIIDQLDYEDGSYAYEWVGNTISYKFPVLALETTSYDFDVDPLGDPGPEAAEFLPLDAATIALVRLAIQAWDDLIAVDFVERASLGAADVEVAFTTAGIHYAHAYYPEDDEDFQSSSGGTVWLNRDYDTDGDPNDLVAAPIGSYGFNTYLHELGHAIGLDHMGDYTPGNPGPFSFQDTTVHSVMSYFGPAGPDESNLVQQADWTVAGETYDAQTPMMSDVLAIQAIYGVSMSTRTGNTTYGFNASGLGGMAVLFDFTQNLHPVVCIFDSDGNDTLDLSGFSGHNVISLVSGTLSSASNGGSESMTNNLSIAHSATIENAMGGSGNDRMTGNAVSNAITGGAGHDTLEGGGGDDTLTGGAGNDSLDGGGGTDVAVFDAGFAAFTVTLNPLTGAWTFVSAASGTDILRDIEIFEFADGMKTLAELSAANAVIEGEDTDDLLTGSATAETIRGLAGRDTLRGNGGDDSLEGGAGLDTAEFAGARANYELGLGATMTIRAMSGDDGVDTATGIERLRFDDQGVAVDLDGHAGIVARTLGAVFGDAFVANPGYVKAGLGLVDGGMDFETVMGLALALRLGPGASHADVVNLLYTNVIGTAPSDGELQAFVGLLDSGTFTPAGLGVYAAQTVFNDLNIGMAGLQANGLAFDL